MSNKYRHNFSSFVELSPFILVHSLLMHVIVLSFLLTLPMYSRADGKASLWGYYVYLTGEGTNIPHASKGPYIPEKQTEAAQNIKTAINPGMTGDDVKNEEETAPAVGPVQESANNDIKVENITGEGLSIIKQNEITDNKLSDIKPSSAGPGKGEKIIEKETDKIGKTETATSVSAVERGVQTEKPVGPYIQPEVIVSGPEKYVGKKSWVDRGKDIEGPSADLQPPSKNAASMNEIKMPAKISLLTEPPSVVITGKGKITAKGKQNIEKPETPEQFKSVQGEKKLPIITPDNNRENSLLQKRVADEIPSPALEAKAAASVRQQKEYTETPKTSEGIISEPDKTQNEKTMPSMPEHNLMDTERPVISLRQSSGKDISETKKDLPESDSQPGRLSAEMMEKTAATEKGKAKIEKPQTPDQILSVNDVDRVQKITVFKTHENEKTLSGKVADTLVDKKTFPLITTKKPLENTQPQKGPVNELSIKSKTGETASVEKHEKKTEATKTIVGPQLSENATRAESPAQNHVKEIPEHNVLSIKKEEEPRLLPDISNVIKKAFSESRPIDEKTPGSQTEAKMSTNPPVLAGVTSESYNRTEKAQPDMKYDKGPEKKEKATSITKEKVEKAPEPVEEKSVLGLSMDESFFHRDIMIEILKQKAESQGVHMYLLKNSYLSLSKRHSWGKEKKIETIAETNKKNDAGSGMRTVFSVAKSEEGIYTFVIENAATVPFNAEAVFTLYGGQKRERVKKISALSVPPLSMLRFMFVLPDALFWDDEKYFTGSLEDSDSITKFNDETGFVWKELKDN